MCAQDYRNAVAFAEIDIFALSRSVIEFLKENKVFDSIRPLRWFLYLRFIGGVFEFLWYIFIEHGDRMGGGPYSEVSVRDSYYFVFVPPSFARLLYSSHISSPLHSRCFIGFD